MGRQEKAPEHERRDWTIILIILLLGFLSVILAGGWSIRFSPFWKLNTNMGSNIDPNSSFLTNRPSDFLEPLDPSILTQPVWIDVFLTPGASFETRTPPPTDLVTNTPPATVTVALLPTFTSTAHPTVTSTLPYVPPPPPTSTSKPKPPPTSTSIPLTPTNTPISPTPTSTTAPLPLDLQVTKNDGSTTYAAGGSTTYTVVVTNNGPTDVIGAVLTDNKPAQITNWSWACTAQNGGASGCDPVSNSSTTFSDTIDLPNGGSITYTVTANISAAAGGTLTNTAVISAPAGYTETAPGNNSAADSDMPATNEPDIGGPDGNSYNPGPNGSITILFSPGILADGTGSPDFVYYEIVSSPGFIDMDWVMIEISPDGSTWYTVFVWGDGNPDTNSNLDINVIGGTEADNRQISTVDLYNQTGVTVNIDAIPGIVTGTRYTWIRISGIGGVDGPDIDAIQPYYP